MGRRPRKHQHMTVSVAWPKTEEGMNQLRDRMTTVMLEIAEKQLGPELLANVMEHAEQKEKYKN